MKNTKRTIIILLIIIFTIISLLAIYLSSKVEDNPNSGGSINNNINEKSFKKVDTYNEFFSIQNTLNNSNEINTSYAIHELYLNSIGNTKYYFIKCSRFISNGGTEKTNYDKNIYYLLLANNNKYDLIELNDTIDDLESYAKNYEVIDKKVNSSRSIQKGYANEENIITYYIEYFKNMLIIDTENAYEMLSDETKLNYTSYTNFYNQAINIYNKLSSKVFAYSKKEIDGDNVYYLEDDNRNKIVIYENEIMNFKISY